MEKTLGGDRLGSGGKMTVELKTFGLSTFNVGKAVRTTMAVGTLVPIYCTPVLNGDTYNIDASALVRTLPTLGPLFGSFKLQIDFFVAPMRLYNRQLHNNKIDVGMNMSKVLFPKLKVRSTTASFHKDPNIQQINPSSIFAYLGLRGLGRNEVETANPLEHIDREINAMPYLSYWDIFKNYYANRQENDAWFISTEFNEEISIIRRIQQFEHSARHYLHDDDGWFDIENYDPNNKSYEIFGYNLFKADEGTNKIEFMDLMIRILHWDGHYMTWSLQSLLDEKMIIIDGWNFGGNYFRLTLGDNLIWSKTHKIAFKAMTTLYSASTKPVLKSFKLKKIDDIREDILGAPNSHPYYVDSIEDTPFSDIYKQIGTSSYYKPIGAMYGLALKTYHSDRFNNFLSSEWIDGANGIAEITRIDTTDGLTMDALKLAQCVYNMLNQIAVSGGTYQDWQDAVYGQSANNTPETPWFAGGFSQEITFSEVTSTAEVGDENPLGSMAGKGYSNGQGKTIHINVVEPSYIIGIASITPRLDYCQGNKWFNKLETMADLHVPFLDKIGFQELCTDEMAAFDWIGDKFNSMGKQPAWIHYMTDTNECFGNFALPNSEMYMTLNRYFEPNINKLGEYMGIKDLTTYIDPQKFNNNFALTNLDAQNFWVQIGLDIMARRKMSAKIIPNM